MRLIYIPQVAVPGESVSYDFKEDKIIAHHGGHQETFNFQGMPDGRAESITADHLPFCPVVAAERVNGELTVTLLHWYGADAEDWEKEQREDIV